LNFTAGDIVPNSVQVGLPTAGANPGQIDIFYKGGVAGATTEVLIDVVGYLVAEGSGRTTIIEFSDPGDTAIPKDTAWATGFVRIAAPTDGKIVVSASASVEAIQIPGQEILIQTSHVAPLAITRGFPAVAGEPYDFSLSCETNLSDVVVRNLPMTAIFTSTP
jgi:hypothetical protein